MLATASISTKQSKPQKATVDDAVAAFKKQLEEMDLTSSVEEEDPLRSAQKRELLVWIDRCKKRTFPQYFRDMWRNDNHRNRLELLHYCPNRGRDCLILYCREYSELLDELNTPPSLPFKGYCNCGMPADCFQSFLPRDEYIKIYGQGSLRDDTEEHEKVV